MPSECCSSLLPRQILEVGQSLIILLAVLKEDVQVPVWLLGSLRHIESMLIISCRPADLHTGEDSAGMKTADGFVQEAMKDSCGGGMSKVMRAVLTEQHRDKDPV